MNGEGSIELKSWFVSRSCRLMVCWCPRSFVAVLVTEKRIGLAAESILMPSG